MNGRTKAISHDATAEEAVQGFDAPRQDAVVSDEMMLPDTRLDDLAQIIQAYTQVTDKLEKSHQHLADEVQRLQKELASTDAQLQRSRRLAALGEMAAGIAHEIRNPLAAIQLYAGMLVQDMQQLQQVPEEALRQGACQGVTQQAADTARKINSAVRGLDAIVNDVLTFSREMNPRLSRVPVPVVIARAVEAMWPVLDQAGIRLKLPDADTRGELDDLSLLADAELVHQAMLNLLRNAVDAMLEQARRAVDAPQKYSGVLTIDAYQQGAHGVLVVRDTGSGVDPKDIDRLFNPFFTTRDTGTGLGLAIVHRIADAHGGAVAVHNDHGAVFELSLPLAMPQDASTFDAEVYDDSAMVGEKQAATETILKIEARA